MLVPVLNRDHALRRYMEPRFFPNFLNDILFNGQTGVNPSARQRPQPAAFLYQKDFPIPENSGAAVGAAGRMG